jgi:hypothetical protein
MLDTGNDKVVAYRREKDGNRVRVTVNLSGVTQQYSLPGGGAKRSLGGWAYVLDAAIK